MDINKRPLFTPSKERGAVLVVGLLLMVVLIVLGVTSLSVQSSGLAMAGNAQFQRTAFQAAETGIDIAINQRNFTTTTPVTVPLTVLGDGTYETTATTTFQETTPVPDLAFSMGEDDGTLAAYHFEVVSTGTGPDNALSVHNQSFYIVGPGGN